jgi:hypothetical protein
LQNIKGKSIKTTRLAAKVFSDSGPRELATPKRP